MYSKLSVLLIYGEINWKFKSNKHVYDIIDAFTKEKFTGNRAGVVTNADGLTKVQMQKIAREMNNSETSFIFSSDRKE